jgi:hypothetical protein
MKALIISDDQNTIEVNGRIFEAQRTILGCNGCYFESGFCKPEIPCHITQRNDKVNVIFKLKK